MTSCVVDASVAAKWFLPVAGESLGKEAWHVFQEFRDGRLCLLVPDLFWPEFGNIQWKAVRRKRISQGSAEEAIAVVEALAFVTAATRPLLKDAFEIAAAYERSVYDGIYVALAVSSGAPLVTADERLVNALGSRFPVRWLGALD